MRRWVLVTGAMLLAAALMSGYARFPARRRPGRAASRMAEAGLVLLDEDAGLYVLGVIDGSPACDAGIRPGDYLTSARGKPLTVTAQLEELLATQDNSVALPMTLNRHERSVTVHLSFQ